MVALAALVSTYLDHLSIERGVSPHTSAAYRRDLRRYTGFLADHGVIDAGQVTPALVNDYAVSLREGDPKDAVTEEGTSVAAAGRRLPLASASVARAVVAVRSLHRFALEEGLVSDDPASAVQPPRAARRLPKALSIDQVQAILDVPATDTELGLRDLALLELLYGTGARITEAVSLDVDEVARAIAPQPAPDTNATEVNTDADIGHQAGLRVLGKGGKERIVPLGSYAQRALSAYLTRARPTLAARGRGTPALFLNARGSRLSRQSAWTILQTSAVKAGVTVAVSPHTMRHSFATHLLDGGADVRVVQELLGHASVTTTQIYTLVTVDHLREVYLGSHPRAY